MNIITRYEAIETIQCYDSITYFIENYFKIQHPVKGSMYFNLYDYQKNIINIYENSKMCIGMTARQMGNTSIATAYMLWNLIFKLDFQIAIIGNNIAYGQEILNRLLFAFDQLPTFLKPKIDLRNKRELRFENGSGLIVLTTNSPHSARGRSLNLIYFDDFAFADQNNATELWQSIIPCASIGSQIIVTSTPSNKNTLFYKLWQGAVSGNNGFHPFIIRWNDHPDRDESFKQSALKSLGPDRFAQEYECQFIDQI